MKNDLHPTMKPVALIERAIRNSSKRRDIVLDPFGGSGSTLIAAEKTGRQARLVELDPQVCRCHRQALAGLDRWLGHAGGRRADVRLPSCDAGICDALSNRQICGSRCEQELASTDHSASLGWSDVTMRAMIRSPEALGGAMVEHVDRWLESLGLGKYAALFADNEITADVLPDLTDAELKELGLPLGARKKIIKAASTGSATGSRATGLGRSIGSGRAHSPQLRPSGASSR